jgi:long-chain acyl-CoA synthetase
MSDEGNQVRISVFCGLAEIVRTHSRMRRDEPAFIGHEGTVSWLEFERRAARIAAALGEKGVRQGDRVALLTGNAVWAYEALIGILTAGAVPALLPPLLPPDALARLCADSDAQVLLTSAPALPLAQACLAAEPGLRATLMVEGEEAGIGPVQALPALNPDDPCSIIYSSGTTGTPKGIVHSHRVRLWMAASLAAAFAVKPGSRILLSTPPFTNGTWILMLPAVLAGACMVVCEKFSADAALDLIEAQAITHAFMVPTQFSALVNEPRWPDVDLGSLEMVLTAGAPMPDALRKQVRARLPGALHELWGLTEGVAVISGPSDMDARPGSVGRASGGVDLVILDEKGRPAPPGEVGEIAGRSPSLMTGYLNRPDATRAVVWSDQAGRTYLKTGDLGMLDEDGYLYLRGRAKDIIISGGMNIYATDLEAALLELPEVADAAVVGAPSAKWGETPAGFVILARCANADAQALLDRVNAALGRHQRLSQLHIHPGDFPRNALGKVLKNDLRKRLEDMIAAGDGDADLSS